MKYNSDTVLLDAENVRSAYRSIVDNGPIKVLFGLLNNEHYAAAKDIASILEDQMSLANFMSRITPVVIEVDEKTVEEPTQAELVEKIADQVKVLTVKVDRLTHKENEGSAGE